LREIKYIEVKTQGENHQPLLLSYSVLVDKFYQQERYGVKVTNKNSGEIALALDLTTEAETIYELLDKLAKNTVTPTSLADVVVDWQAGERDGC